MLSDINHSNLWTATACPAPTTVTLSGKISADVAIVGAGYTGLSTALHLAQAGLDAVVLEAKNLGHGGSGRNVGLVNAGLWVMPNALIETLGERWGLPLISALGDGPSLVFSLIEKFGIACEPVRNGTLHLGIGESGYRELGERERQWQALGAPVRRLNDEETARLVGTRHFSGSLLDQRAGTIQPLGYVRGLARAALDTGARIYTRTPVTAARNEGGKWRIETHGGAITASWLVIATNAYSELVPGFTFANQQTELTVLPFFQLATEPLPHEVAAGILPERQGCWDTRTVMTSMRMDEDRRLIFGSVGALEQLSTAAQRGFAERMLAKLFPALRGVRIDHFWHGQIGMTDNALPKFHRHGPNAIGVNGFNGRGIAPGTVFGHAMARHIAHGEEMILPESPIKPVRYSALKSRFYKAGSHALHLISARI